MIGLSLRAENTAQHHYEGSVWRLGRALTESVNKELFEHKVIAIIKDERLDKFNRGLMLLLYEAYLYSLPENTAANEKIRLLKKDSVNYPAFLHTSIEKLEERNGKEGD